MTNAIRNDVATGECTPAPITSVDEGRRQIDMIDELLHALLQQRRALSTQIQDLRLVEGGIRVVHGRELEIKRRWSAALGEAGPDVADAVLRLCRGPAPTDPTPR